MEVKILKQTTAMDWKLNIFEMYLEQFKTPGECEGMARRFTPDLAGMYK